MAEVSVPADAVSVAVPALVSLYRKLALLEPAAMLTLVMFAVLAVLRKTPVVVSLVLRATVVAAVDVAGLPKVSSIITVIVAEFTPAVSVCGKVVNTNLLAVAA